MVQSHRLNRLRFGLARMFRRERPVRTGPVPALHLLLPVPIEERLVLLARIDGADEREIRQVLGLRPGDDRLSPEAIQRGVDVYQRAVKHPFAHWPRQYTRLDGGCYWNERWGAEIDRCLRELLWSDVAVALIGEGVPAGLTPLNLRQRLVIYCLIVEEVNWQTTMELMRCSQWFIRRALIEAQELIGGL